MKNMKNRNFFIWISIILVVFIILMTYGCMNRNKPAANKASEVVKKPFEANATIKLKDLTLNADINKTEAGEITLKVLEPKTLKNMEFRYDGTDIKVSYRGLTVKIDENSKIVSTIVGLIGNSINKAASGSGIDVKIENGQVKLSGESNSGKFNILLDKNNQSVASINLPELDFSCSFDKMLLK